MAVKIDANKGLPIPISFAVAVILTLALFVFFGAWAVSADSESHNRTLALAFAGPSAILLAESEANNQSAGQAQNLDSATGGGSADTWWGRSLLTACPLH
ncbi:MAG: hypothetical protein IIC99_05850 [Chloroflexi bacterium]|nr:hypothetical protein [Chloroflexota bacterium]